MLLICRDKHNMAAADLSKRHFACRGLAHAQGKLWRRAERCTYAASIVHPFATARRAAAYRCAVQVSKNAG